MSVEYAAGRDEAETRRVGDGPAAQRFRLDGADAADDRAGDEKRSYDPVHTWGYLCRLEVVRLATVLVLRAVEQAFCVETLGE